MGSAAVGARMRVRCWASAGVAARQSSTRRGRARQMAQSHVMWLCGRAGGKPTPDRSGARQ
eukprot:433353-Pleurochrysis_carterae.AAC.1